MTIPLVDLSAQHAAIEVELRHALDRVLRHARFVDGPEVATFEANFAAFCEVPHCVGVSSGTDALAAGLAAAGIGAGDEVIVPSMTFIATAEAVVQVGARPILCDCEPSTGLIGIPQLEAAIGARTAAIVAVHLYGQMVNVNVLQEIAQRHGLLLVEDAAQAHGARFAGRRAGSAGAFAAFSFYPGKNLGALGDAGALTTTDGELARRAKRWRDHGRETRYVHEELGTNARLDTIQAALLGVKLPRLEGWNERRRVLARRYQEAFAGLEQVRPLDLEPSGLPVYHQYVVRIALRDQARTALSEQGITAGVHYPIPLHRQPALSGMADPNSFPGADQLAGTVLSLPIYPELTISQQDHVITALRTQVGGPAEKGSLYTGRVASRPRYSS